MHPRTFEFMDKLRQRAAEQDAIDDKLHRLHRHVTMRDVPLKRTAYFPSAVIPAEPDRGRQFRKYIRAARAVNVPASGKPKAALKKVRDSGYAG